MKRHYRRKRKGRNTNVDYVNSIATLSDYEKFMLCDYCISLIKFIDIEEFCFETFYEDLIYALKLKKTKVPKLISKTFKSIKTKYSLKQI